MSRPTHDAYIMFRGEEREIHYEYDGDGVFVWWFPDLSEAEHDALDIADAEHAAVHEKLWGIWSAPDSGPVDWDFA